MLRIYLFDKTEALGRAAAALAARTLRETVRRKGKAVFVAATGASQFAFLEALVREEVPWERTVMFHLDEYIGLPADHPASFRRYLRERLVDRVRPGTVHFIEGDAPDPAAEVQRLNGLIQCEEVDIAFVGIGENGHIAFNDPPADFETDAPYIIVELAESCRRQQVSEGWFPSLHEVPQRAITMSVRQILRSKRILSVVPEARKAAAVRCALEGEISPACPASILRTHPDVHLFLDRGSAGLLSPDTLERYRA